MDTFEKFKDMSVEEANAYLEELDSCSFDCSACGLDCSDRIQKPAKKLIAMISGKGGTGKTVMSVLLARALMREGLKAAVLDADVVGAGVPQTVGLHDPVIGDAEFISPVVSKGGVPVVSMALIADDPAEPILWPGLEMAKVAVYFLTQAKWGEPDVLIIDMPSGAGDVPIEYYTTMPMDNSIAVSMPGKLAELSMIRAVNLAEMLRVPVMGVIMNFDDDRERTSVRNIPVVATVPFDPEISRAVDEGRLDLYETDVLDFLARAISESM